MNRALLCVTLLATLAAVGSRPARAQEADDALAQAKQYVHEAEQLYRLGDFSAALELYSKAYKAKSFPAFLFNIGQCHRELKDYEKATFFYRSYLRDSPDAANRAVVEQLIVDCEAALATQLETARQAEVERKAEAERQRQAEEERRQAAEEERRLEQERLATERLKAAAAAAEAERRKQEQDAPVWETWWFWTAIGGAAVAVAGGVAAGVLLSDPGTRDVMPSGSLGTLDRRGE